MNAFGFSYASWSDAVKRGAIISRRGPTPMSELLVAGAYRGRNNLKLRLIKEGLKQPSCERCGLVDWLCEPIALALHHINGDRLDNRLENLELLCPNCHSQTDTFAGRNRPKTAPADDGAPDAAFGDDGQEDFS
jgi:5-methylcytosine-specific restriction endonuclease McrA